MVGLSVNIEVVRAVAHAVGLKVSVRGCKVGYGLPGFTVREIGWGFWPIRSPEHRVNLGNVVGDIFASVHAWDQTFIGMFLAIVYPFVFARPRGLLVLGIFVTERILMGIFGRIVIASNLTALGVDQRGLFDLRALRPKSFHFLCFLLPIRSPRWLIPIILT